MNIKGQGYSLTVVQGHSDSTFLNFFPFHVKPPCDEGMKVNANALCHMIKMVAMRIYVRNF